MKKWNIFQSLAENMILKSSIFKSVWSVKWTGNNLLCYENNIFLPDRTRIIPIKEAFQSGVDLNLTGGPSFHFFTNHRAMQLMNKRHRRRQQRLRNSPAHLVLARSGGPGAPVPPSLGLVSRTLISYSVSGSRWPILWFGLSTGWMSIRLPDMVRYSTSFSMIGPSPLIELALSWIHR